MEEEKKNALKKLRQLQGFYDDRSMSYHQPLRSDEPILSESGDLLWYEILDIVKQNCTTAFVSNPQDA